MSVPGNFSHIRESGSLAMRPRFVPGFSNKMNAGRRGGRRRPHSEEVVVAMDPFEQVTHDMRDFAVEVKRLGYSMPNGYENRFVELSERMVKCIDDLRSPESCRACVQDERDGRGIRRKRFCMPPIGIVTAPPTRTWRTW
jgi:hypothetical protein